MKKNLGIIGVVVLFIIVVIIASITYSYIESIRIKPIDEISDYIQGELTEIIKQSTITYKQKSYDIYLITLMSEENEKSSYQVFFYNLYPPLDQLNLKLYYDEVPNGNESVYRIVRVEMI